MPKKDTLSSKTSNRPSGVIFDGTHPVVDFGLPEHDPKLDALLEAHRKGDKAAFRRIYDEISESAKNSQDRE